MLCESSLPASSHSLIYILSRHSRLPGRGLQDKPEKSMSERLICALAQGLDSVAAHWLQLLLLVDSQGNAQNAGGIFLVPGFVSS